jgi:hypothetical protein
MSKTESVSALERMLATIDAACKEKTEPKPCVVCKKITSLSLRTSRGHVKAPRRREAIRARHLFELTDGWQNLKAS